MNTILVVAAGSVAAGWATWLLTGWYAARRQRRLNAERFHEWMTQERTITSTLDEIRNLPETKVGIDG